MKILIVDDEIVSRTKLFRILNGFGDCVVSGSGTDALDEFHRAWVIGDSFNLVLLDIGLVDMSGIEVLKMIRTIEKGRGRKSKVVIVTSHADRESITGSVEAGCSSYIIKPFDRDQVMEKLNQIGIDVSARH